MKILRMCIMYHVISIFKYDAKLLRWPDKVIDTKHVGRREQYLLQLSINVLVLS